MDNYPILSRLYDVSCLMDSGDIDGAGNVLDSLINDLEADG